MDNHVIQILDMEKNDIGDDGITAIATALTNSRIRKLWVVKCGITVTGARSIATLLSVNHHIQELWLLDNPMTKEGVHVILQSALNNSDSQVDISIDREYYTDSEIKTTKNILMRRRWGMETHEVGYVM